ncbi:MAG: ECF transporter S component [Propionibacteriaceae bacterium]|jgi:energy-coupling factor transport system substrate-specific component|nr:ECF transporter S component [Propionibacteriaceae bacterium]
MSAAGRSERPIPVGPKSVLLLTLVSLAGLAMFAWPLFRPAQPAAVQHAEDAPFIFVLILPLLVLLVLVQLTERGMDAKALAMLGVLSAVIAALRPLGAGLNGIETVFFLMILAGRVFGPGFGFVLGCSSIFASALLTAGVGPWMPFQMLASAWVGMGAGLLPERLFGKPVRGWREMAWLIAYGIVAAYLFGLIMNLWFWPYVSGFGQAGLDYVAGGPLLDNLRRFLIFTLVSSTAVWDTGRAITDTVLIAVLGPGVLAILRRAVRRANFDPVVEFDPVSGG